MGCAGSQALILLILLISLRLGVLREEYIIKSHWDLLGFGVWGGKGGGRGGS